MDPANEGYAIISEAFNIDLYLLSCSRKSIINQQIDDELTCSHIISNSEFKNKKMSSSRVCYVSVFFCENKNQTFYRTFCLITSTTDKYLIPRLTMLVLRNFHCFSS